MARKMKQRDSGIVINVTEHVIAKNFWEYYVTDDKHNETVFRCLVMGYEIELGDVCLKELAPHILSRTKSLDRLLAAQGWDWIA